MNIFDLISLKDFELFLKDFQKTQMNKLPIDEILNDVKCENKILSEKFMNTWYDSIKDDYSNPAYWIYGEPLYLGEVLFCWKKYSRTYIKLLRKLNLKNINKILDLGCGIGFTTLALSEQYNCDVFGTNIKDTLQYDINKFVINKYGTEKCHIIDSNFGTNEKIDLIFASEFFEHIINPIELLKDILNFYKPRYFIFANSFKPKNIGHFNNYLNNGELIDPKKTSYLFSKMLKDNGYKRVDTHFYNDRPCVYEKINFNEYFYF